MPEGRLPWVKAISRVLASARSPMTAEEIGNSAIAHGYRPQTDFPEYSVQAAISRDIKSNGAASPFRVVEREGELKKYTLR